MCGEEGGRMHYEANKELSKAGRLPDTYKEVPEEIVRAIFINSSQGYAINEEKASDSPGYHLREIKKGVLGELTKVREELEEAEDAASQGCDIMELVELSDLYGALKAYVEKRHGKTMKDLEVMSAITERAFISGRRI